jgi:signal peptidase I
MIDTLLIKDRIVVNKLVYGPELLPGLGKTSTPWKPERNRVIIFENPSYISRGPAFDIAQRLLYMGTLSLVDIDRDQNGQPKAHFLIKRCVGLPGDTFYNDNGNMRIKFAGEDRIVNESDYNKARGWDTTHNVTRRSQAADYPALEANADAQAYSDLGLTVPAGILTLAQDASKIQYPDYITWDRANLELKCTAAPQDERLEERLARHYLGWYVPANRILPLGDNRDNSRDGRYFGPVRLQKVLGEAAVKYWPLQRIGLIR